MNIVHLIFSFNTGGTETMLVDYTKALKLEFYESVIIDNGT